MRLFDHIRHQEPAIAALQSARARGRLAHAMLFWGPEGVGKLRSAQALAQMLLCEGSEPPCASCVSCERVRRLTHPDLLIVVPAARGEGDVRSHMALEAYGEDLYHCFQAPPNASILIDQIRELKSESSKARVERGNRVAIIRDAERMTPEAAQAALKLIEEPRPGTYLVLTCRDPQQLLPTILSRCQRFRFRPLPRSFIEEVLREQRPAEEEAPPARLVSALARGSLSRALAGGGDGDLRRERDRALELFAVTYRDPAEVTGKVRALGRAWDTARARAAVDLLMMWYEDLLHLRLGLSEEDVANSDRLERLRAEASAAGAEEIKRRGRILEELLEAMERNVNPVLATETALLRLSRLAGERDLF